MPILPPLAQPKIVKKSIEIQTEQYQIETPNRSIPQPLPMKVVEQTFADASQQLDEAILQSEISQIQIKPQPVAKDETLQAQTNTIDTQEITAAVQDVGQKEKEEAELAAKIEKQEAYKRKVAKMTANFNNKPKPVDQVVAVETISPVKKPPTI